MTICLVSGLCVSACHKAMPVHPDKPYVAPGSVVQDVMFHSAALNRDMPYRVFLPAHIDTGERLPVVFLLHGANGSFRNWSNYSTVSTYAAKGLILVMPEGEFSYYTNAAGNPAARFGDYTFTDLISDVDSRFPVARTRDKRAIIGISMGGFAAIETALTKPEMFSFAGALSPSVEITHRRFHIRRWGEWRRIRKIFGPWGSETRISRDPFALVRSADPSKTPYLYLTAGENEPLLMPNRDFASRLAARHFEYEFHTRPGGHDWNEWNSQIPGCFESLLAHISAH